MPSEVSWTPPSAGSHPRIWISNTNGPTVSSIQARCASGGTHRKYYNEIVAFCNARLANPVSYFIGKDAEYLSAFAFVWLVDNLRTDCAAKARDVALDFANDPVVVSNNNRQKMIAMGRVYDWLYNWSGLTNANKVTIRNALGNLGGWIEAYKDVSETDFLWGTDHGHSNGAWETLCAILEDSNLNGGAGNPPNSTWRGWMDTLWDTRLHSTLPNFWAGFRYFADTSTAGRGGGSHKGVGPFGYWERNQEFYVRTLPAMKSALNQPIGDTENWWRDTTDLDLWTHRGDNSKHRTGEVVASIKHSRWTQNHAIIRATLLKVSDPTRSQANQWLSDKIGDSANGGQQIEGNWGPYHQFFVLHRDTTLDTPTPSTPTIAGLGGGKQMRVFERCGLICIREGWADDDVSLTIEAPNFFLGGHQKRSCGHINLCVHQQPLLIFNGHYNPNEDFPYKQLTAPTDPVQNGHRYTYAKNGLAQSAPRIRNSDEPIDNPVDSYQLSLSSSRRFGTKNGSASTVISNYGGQLWPKNTGATLFQPGHIGQVIGGYGASAEPKWNRQSLIHAEEPVGGLYCYVVINMGQWYWTGKQSRMKRHLLWVKTGAIPGWDYPLILVWDDIIAASDATFTNKTTRLQWQTNMPPTGSGSALQFSRASGRLQVNTVIPTSGILSDTVAGFVDDEGVTYTPVDNIGEYDDSVFPTGLASPYRTEVFPAVYSGSIHYLTALWPAAAGAAAPPAVTAIDNGSFLGLLVDPTGSMIECKMAKGDVHSASVSVFTPPAPTLPALDQDRRSYGTHPVRTVFPYGDNGAVGLLDRRHAAWLARKQAPAIPIDISDGEEIGCDDAALAGAAIPSTAGAAGATIETEVPAPVAGAPLEGC